MTCKHLNPWRYAKPQTCAAFPVEIPRELLFGGISHTEPYANDQGIRYEFAQHSYSRKFNQALLAGDESDLFPFALRSFALFDEPSWSTQVCIDYCLHEINYVRAEAMLGLFHVIKNHKFKGIPKNPLFFILQKELLATMGTTQWAAALTLARSLESHLGWELDAKHFDQSYKVHLDQLFKKRGFNAD